MNAIAQIDTAAINPLAYPQFPAFAIDTKTDIETDESICTFGVVSFAICTKDGLSISLTTSMTVEVNDTASVQANSLTPYDGWCDIDYTYPQLTKFSLCTVVDTDGVNIAEGALISLTEQQIHVLNEMISQAAYETATAYR